MQPKYLDLSPEDLKKAERNRSKRETNLKVDPEQLFIAEFGKHFGWPGVQSLLNNEVDGETALWLIQGARKIEYSRVYDMAQAVLMGSVSAQAKRPFQVFKSVTKNVLKASKADV